jgi:hypothetical protein
MMPKLHHEGTRAAARCGAFEAIDLRDVRMVTRRERLRVAGEACEALLVQRESSGSTLMAIS